MKKILLLLLLLPAISRSQNYFAKADSCIRIKNYSCAAVNYDMALKSDSESNGLAYIAAKAWAMAEDKEKTVASLRIYIRNNALNNHPFFSAELLKEKTFDFLHNDRRWKEMITGVQRNENALLEKEKRKVDSLVAIQRNLEKHQMSHHLNIDKSSDSRTSYERIKNYNDFPVISSRYLSLQFKINDSLNTAFLVVMPQNYDPKRSYPVLFFLHGAVNMNTGFPPYCDDRDTKGWNRFYTKYSGDVIMVYPHGDSAYNWMYPDNGFYMVPAILKQIKQIINVDDNRVFVSGHSNGATGSFSYLMKQPSPFAAFYGFNTRPRVQTGGTYIRNILNRSYFNVSTDQDYYFPPRANDSLDTVMKNIGADYQDHRYNGFPHWFPQFDQSEPAYQLLFADLAKRKRNPFHHEIYWECDDVKYGVCDWIEITGLDTLAKRASWHQNINFKVNKWIVLGRKNIALVRDTLLNGFNYRKQSGAVKATYSNNKFIVETSDVKSFTLLISPEMVDLRRPVTVIVNGKLCSRQKIGYNKNFMLNQFKKTLDRKAVWVNYINIKVS